MSGCGGNPVGFGRGWRSAATAAAASVLLAACAAPGGHEAAQGPAAEKEPIAAASSGQPGGASGVLDARQVADVLPRQGAVPGAVAVGKQKVFAPTHPATGCARGKPTADLCADALAIGLSLFSKKGKGTVTFSVMSYKNTSASAAAYDTLHAMWQTDRALTDLAIGPVGERREARRGTHLGTGEPTMKAQVLVGTTLLHVETAGSYAEGDRLTQLATMLAERSERAQASGTGT